MLMQLVLKDHLFCVMIKEKPYLKLISYQICCHTCCCKLSTVYSLGVIGKT